MIVFSGLIACFTFTLLAGWCWPPKEHRNTTYSLIDGSIKSLWIAWILVAVSDLANLALSDWMWPILASFMLFAICINRSKSIPTTRTEIGIIILVLAWLVLRCGNMVLYGARGYTTVFSDWDAIVSWNRWAIELYSNEYAPFAAAYPILFPGIWSLIYRAQETAEVLFIAKLSLFILPLLFLLALILLWKSGNRFSALGASLFFYWFFLGVQKYELFAGSMDGPVAILTATFSILLIPLMDAIEKRDFVFAKSLLTTLAVLAGVTALTKQAGALCLLIFITLSVQLAWQKTISRREAVSLCLVAALPYALFYAMFHSAGQSDIAGNYDYLASLAKDSAKNRHALFNAFYMLSAKGGGFVIISLSLLSAINFLRIRSLRGQWGALLFGAAMVGFITYADCCAYSPRNGWWILSLLIGSALLAISGFKKAAPTETVTPVILLRARSLLVAMALVLFLGSALLGISLNDERAHALQEDAQWRIIPQDLAALLKQHTGNMGPEDVIISPHQLLGWLPGIKDHYKTCTYSDPECVKRVIKLSKNAYILIHKHEKHLKIEGIEHLLGSRAPLGSSKDFLLYGPFVGTH